jgi:hypothetical protein
MPHPPATAPQRKGQPAAGQLPDAPTRGALLALEHARAMLAQTKPAIWFDSWNNDLRDNNLDGRIDDPAELRLKDSDGGHIKGTYKARVAPIGKLSIDQVPDSWLSTIDVTYKVCIDVPIESYQAAHVPISRDRRIPYFFDELKRMPGWRIWDGGDKPPSLMDGDIVAANNHEHGHAGIVETGVIYDSVINLPGPTSSRRFLAFSPSGSNDMVSVPRAAFEGYLSIDVYARWIHG